MNPDRLAAAFDYRSNTRVFLNVRSVSPGGSDQNRTGKEDAELAVLLPPEDSRTKNGRDVI